MVSALMGTESLVNELGKIVGGEWARADAGTVAKYARSTQSAPVAPAAVVLPGNVGEVQELVRFAGRSGMGLYPISCGKNWGYGDACAPTAGQIIVDFARMNRIVEVNEALAYVVIEPGVTQGQLYDFLAAKHPGLWMDATGAGRACSFVGNTLDRGFGHTRYGDHFATACGMEVVLGDGRILRTGYGHYDKARAARAYRYGVGPSLDGLFVQSNMGIVTQIGMWLMPKPEAFCSFFFSAKEFGQLRELVDGMAPLRMAGLLQSTIHIANDLRTLSARMRYPWERTKGEAPLPAEVRREMREEMGVGAWNGCGAIYGTAETVAGVKKALKKAIGPYRLTFLDDKKLAFANRVRGFLGKFGAGEKLGKLLETVTPVYGLLKGIPSNDALRGAMWRVRGEDDGKAVEPLDGHAGIMWVSPVLPTQGETAVELMRLMEPIYQKHGFDPLVTFTMITERAMCCVTNIAYDVRQEEEGLRARACYGELMEVTMGAGFVPYRVGPKGYGKLAQGSSVFWDVVGELKGVMDPLGVLSPGRYMPGGVEGHAGVAAIGKAVGEEERELPPLRPRPVGV